jgi:hypothetical protein
MLKKWHDWIILTIKLFTFKSATTYSIFSIELFMRTTFRNHLQHTLTRSSASQKLFFEIGIKFCYKYSFKCEKIRVCIKNKGEFFLWKNESVMETSNISWILQFNYAVRKFKILKIINTAWLIETCLIQKDGSKRRKWKQLTKQIKVIFYKKFNIANKWILCLPRWRTCFEFDGNHWRI